MNILTNTSKYTNNAGPTIVETLNRRVFNEHEKVKFRVQPLVHNKWHKSLELLEKGKENGLILSTAFDIDIKKDGYEAFVLADKYHKGFTTFDAEEGKKSGGDFLRVKPVPTIDSKSNQNTFLDSFSCRLMYEKELIRCEKVMKPVYIALFKMRIRALASAFNHLLKFMLHRRDIMRRAGEDRLANRRAQTHFFFVMTSKTFTAWYDYVVLQKERLMRLRFVLNTRRTNYFKLAMSAWKVYLIEIVLKNSKTAENLIQNLTEKPEKRLFDLWKLHANQRRLMRKTGFRIQEAHTYFLHAAFHTWYANSLFVLIQNRSYYRLKSRCFQKLNINVKNEYVIYKITKRARRKRIGAWAEQIIQHNLVSIHFTNVAGHAPLVACEHGADARLGTNPITMGFPSNMTNNNDDDDGNSPPIILDFATSDLALGKVRETWARGEKTKDNVLLDSNGEPTNDPSVMFQKPAGALLPFCGHKGYAMALMCEIIGGVLSGGHTIHPKYPRHDERILNSMTTIIFDPSKLNDNLNEIDEEVNDVKQYMRDSPIRSTSSSDKIFIPGELEMLSYEDRVVNGIPVAKGTWDDLVKVAKETGLDSISDS